MEGGFVVDASGECAADRADSPTLRGGVQVDDHVLLVDLGVRGVRPVVVVVVIVAESA